MPVIAANLPPIAIFADQVPSQSSAKSTSRASESFGSLLNRASTELDDENKKPEVDSRAAEQVAGLAALGLPALQQLVPQAIASQNNTSQPVSSQTQLADRLFGLNQQSSLQTASASPNKAADNLLATVQPDNARVGGATTTAAPAPPPGEFAQAIALASSQVPVEANEPVETAPTPTTANATPEPTAPPVPANPVVPAQIPLVTDLVGRGAAGQLAPTDNLLAPGASESITGPPEARVGDRPGTAGNRLAAIISSATRLTTPASPTTEAFAPLIARSVNGSVTPNTATSARVAAQLANVTQHAANLPAASAPSEALIQSGLTAQPPGFQAAVLALDTETDVNARQQPSDSGVTLGNLAATPVQASSVPTNKGATEVSSPAPPVATQLADGILANSRSLDRTGATEFQLRLDPPDLGRVRVSLISSGNEIRGQVTVTTDAVKHLIESQLPELRQRLEAAGVTVHRFDVATGGGGANGGRGYQGQPFVEQPQEPQPVVAKALST